MKVPISWLRTFVDVDMPVPELVEFMGRNGLEVDEVRTPGAGIRDVITARVLSWEPHPDADKLRVVHVTHGDDDVELVCGAANFDTGDVVVHAQVGGAIPGLELAARAIRGVTSNGMLCSARELELGDDHDGIMILPPDTPLGVPIADLLPLGEAVIDIEIMADRGDHLSIFGVARDLAALTGTEVRPPADLPTPSEGGAVAVSIDAADGCSQFVAWTLEDVDVPASSPWWLRQRLAQCGVRSISPLVDITNLVMLELGQPMHAYDLDALDGARLGVRWAMDGEVLTTLDDVERTLRADDLVVVDGARPVGLAGVMGGADTEVTASTTRVVFEAATWDPATIRRTSRRLRLTSEASIRFERRVDPAMAAVACARAVQLVQQVGSATDLGVTSAGGVGAPQPAVQVDAERVRRLIGLDELTTDRQVELLQRVGCDITVDGDDLQVVPPTWRGDLLRAADVAEEVTRLHGFDRIPATLPATGLSGRLSHTQRLERDVRVAVRGFGLHEVITRPFVGEDRLEGIHPGGDAVVLSNPLAKDASAMRTSLVDGLLDAVRHNVGQGRPGVAVFEYGRIFRRAGGPLDGLLDAFGDDWAHGTPDGRSLPTQPRTLGLAVQGLLDGPGWVSTDRTWNGHVVLAVLDEVVRRILPDATLERTPEVRDRFHPGRTVRLSVDGHEVGLVAQLHPAEAEARDLPEPVVIAELLLEPLLLRADPAPRRPGGAIVRHPALSVDVAVVADDDRSWADVEEALRRAAGDLLDDVRVFDVYRGEQVGEGRRSLAARLRLQSPDRQLTGDDEQAVLAAVAREVEAIGATLRS